VTRPLLAALAAGTLCLPVAGCSGGREAPRAADAVKTTTVTMPKSYRFEPAVISVEAGAAVTWKNTDNFTHDVTLASGDDTRHHSVEPGERIRMVFDEPGTYDYVCELHTQDMRGKVVVT
jgi:plastocyanin